MTKADKILIIFLMVVSVGLVVPIWNGAPKANTAVVTVQNKEVLRLDLYKNEKYTVKGTLGNVYIQVKDGKVRVYQETSAHHICSKQGYVSQPNVPIVCLPNETVVTIESNQSTEDTVIQ